MKLCRLYPASAPLLSISFFLFFFNLRTFIYNTGLYKGVELAESGQWGDQCETR